MTPDGRETGWRRAGAVALLVGLAVVVGVFAVGITGGHVGLDDWGYTSGCPFVRGGLVWRNVVRAFCDFGYGAIWMPVTFMSYMLDVSLFGDSWRAYHAVNVGLHLVNFLLVFAFFRAVLADLGRPDAPALPLACALAAVLWAVHPQRAEAVTFVAARKEELWTLFSLAGLLAYRSFLRGRRLLPYALTAAFFLLALLSKPTAMCFPFLLLALAHLVRRLDGRTLLSLLPLFLLSVGAGALTVYSQSHPSNAVAVDVYGATFAWRLLNAAVSLGLYAWYAVWPLGIHMDYLAVFNGWPAHGHLGLAVALAAALGFALAVLFLRGAARRVATGAALLFLFSIGPTLGVLGYVNGDQAMADRYAYFPHVAVFLAVAYFLLSALERVGRAWTVVAPAALLIVAEAAVALPVVKSYENGFTACARALEKDPDNWRALRIVGNEYCARLNRVDDGVAMLRRSLRLRRSQQTADSLAYVLAMRGAPGDFAEVRRLGRAAAKYPPIDEGGLMLDALGVVEMREGRYAQAARFFAAGLKAPKRNHSSDWSLLYLGQNLANLGKTREAAAVLLRARQSRMREVSRRAAEALRALSAAGAPPRFDWRE